MKISKEEKIVELNRAIENLELLREKNALKSEDIDRLVLLVKAAIRSVETNAPDAQMILKLISQQIDQGRAEIKRNRQTWARTVPAEKKGGN
jgi:hypothetical protein